MVYYCWFISCLLFTWIASSWASRWSTVNSKCSMSFLFYITYKKQLVIIFLRDGKFHLFLKMLNLNFITFSVQTLILEFLHLVQKTIIFLFQPINVYSHKEAHNIKGKLFRTLWLGGLFGFQCRLLKFARCLHLLEIHMRYFLIGIQRRSCSFFLEGIRFLKRWSILVGFHCKIVKLFSIYF